jgi:glycosyltransferase involved in cell wall biosynthesis
MPENQPKAEVSLPTVSVIVSTRNRPLQIVPCLQAVLANPGSSYELVVVDQSDTDETQRALEAAFDDSRLRYISTPTRGLSRSRNIAIEQSRAPILAFTDDDCRPPSSWVAGVEQTLARYPQVALVFGRVGAQTESGGFAADFAPAVDRVFAHEVLDIAEPWGVGANMIARRALFDAIGKFDPILGAGGVFPASEDSDIAIRALAGGLPMLYSAELFVEHLGIRQGEDASRLMRAYGMGIGAALAKHARFGTKGGRAMLTRWLTLHGSRVAGNLARRQRPSGAGYFLAGMRGIYESRKFAIDREQAVFVETTGGIG